MTLRDLLFVDTYQVPHQDSSVERGRDYNVLGGDLLSAANAGRACLSATCHHALRLRTRVWVGHARHKTCVSCKRAQQSASVHRHGLDLRSKGAQKKRPVLHKHWASLVVRTGDCAAD
jgi:hypothetical protein